MEMKMIDLEKKLRIPLEILQEMEVVIKNSNVRNLNVKIKIREGMTGNGYVPKILNLLGK